MMVMVRTVIMHIPLSYCKVDANEEQCTNGSVKHPEQHSSRKFFRDHPVYSFTANLQLPTTANELSSWHAGTAVTIKLACDKVLLVGHA